MKIEINKLVKLNACLDGLNYILANKLQNFEFCEKSEIIVDQESEFKFIEWLMGKDKTIKIKSLSCGLQQIVYDENGNKTSYTNTYGKVERWTYDDNGNKTSYTNTDGKVASWIYDEKGILCEVFSSAGFKKIKSTIKIK